MSSKEDIAAAVAAAREAVRGFVAQGPKSGTAAGMEHGKPIEKEQTAVHEKRGKPVEGETLGGGEDVPVMDLLAYRAKFNQQMEGVPKVAETPMKEETPPLKQEVKKASKETESPIVAAPIQIETPLKPPPAVVPAAMPSHPVEEAPIKEVYRAESNVAPESDMKPAVVAPIPQTALEKAAPKKEEGFDPAAHVRQTALGQLDRNKDGVITGDELVAAAHQHEKLKKRVKASRMCAAIAAILLIIVIGIWIGIAILAGRVTGGVKVVGGGFYVSRGNGRVVSTGRSLYAVPTPVANKLLGLTPAQLETLETVTFAVSGQPIEVQMKIAGLASRANFLELRSATGDTLTVVPGAQTYTSATLPSAPGTLTSAYTFAPVG